MHKSFCTKELWQLYSTTREEKYRKCAELRGSKLSAPESLQNPEASWGAIGDDTIIDTMAVDTMAKDTGLPLVNIAAPGQSVFAHTSQGFGADTTRSRRAGWAFDGFSTAYSEMPEPLFLAITERIADYAIENLTNDFLPSYDFDDEGVRFRNRDSSAAAIIAGGLFRPSVITSARARDSREAEERIVQSLIDRYLTPIGDNAQTPPAVLRHGCGRRPNDAMLFDRQYHLRKDRL
jgi:hypothetical protein